MSSDYIPDIRNLLIPFEIYPSNPSSFITIEDTKNFFDDYYADAVKLYNDIKSITTEINLNFERDLTKSIFHLNIGQAEEDCLHNEDNDESEKIFIDEQCYYQSVPKHLITFAGNNANVYINVLIVSTNRYKHNSKPYILNDHLINTINKTAILTDYNILRVTEIKSNVFQIKFYKNEIENNGSVINVYLYNTCFPSEQLIKSTRVTFVKPNNRRYTFC